MAGVATTAPQTGTQKRARWWVWLSLIGSAFGLMSVFNDLIPNLIRLSILFKAAVSVYRQAREWLFDGALRMLAAIGVVVPDISELTKDIIVVGALVLAALNWESVRRFGQSLILSWLRDFWGAFSARLGGVNHNRQTIFDGGDKGFVTMSLGFWALGWVLLWGLTALGFEMPRVPFVPTIVTAGVLAAFLGILAIVLMFVVNALYGPPDARPADAVQFLARFVFGVIGAVPHLAGMAWVGLVNGRRAVALAIGLVLAFLALNVGFLYVVDPLIADGAPRWLQVLIDADPQALRETGAAPQRP